MRGDLVTKIGFISEGVCGSEVSNMKAIVVNKDHPNFPLDKTSPNYPRANGRLDGFQNPLLGDTGWGEISRWKKVDTGVLYNIVDQIIAQYIRDKDWYSTVRCKESLWNMYRRLEWWVEQTVGINDVEHSQALTFIKECIYKILDTGEEDKLITKYKFAGEYLDGFQYIGNWEIDKYGYLRGEGSEFTTLSTTVNYPSKGLLTFNFSPEGYVEDFVLYMDDIEMWRYASGELKDNLYTFRDITISIPMGEHTFKWNVGYGVVRFDEFEFIELEKNRESDENLPKCPPSYVNKYSSDYTNFFNNIPYERPIFSTTGTLGVSEPLDILRYVSSKENIEWDLVTDLEGAVGENVLKLPLERLPETLSSKLTFNMRLKRKGYISFKYLMESGEGSRVSLYVNNRKATYDLEDTSDWEEVRVNLSQSQTYKFDIMVHKLFSADIDLNAVYIKDVEVVEVTEYTDSPMPGDYTYEGQKLPDKWLIYSHRNALASYYRGFPDGEEDMVREFEFELYSECDGVFGFEHILGTEKPDRFFVEGTVFTEQFKLDDSLIVWDGGSNGVDIPSIYVKPTYGSWDNKVTSELGSFGDFIYWTKDDTTLNYNITIDHQWDRGLKWLNGEMTLSVMCPPKYLIKSDYIKATQLGNWVAGSDWMVNDNRIIHSSPTELDYTVARYSSIGPVGSYIVIKLNEDLAVGEKLNIKYGGVTRYNAVSGFGSDEVTLFTDPNNTLEFEIVKPEPEEPVYGVTFVDDLDFETGFMSDGRGRDITITTWGGDVSGDTLTTNSGFSMDIRLKAGEEVFIRLPNRLIPYINRKEIDQQLEDLVGDLELGEPETVFYEDFNEPNVATGVPIIQQGYLITDNGSVITSQGGTVTFMSKWWVLESVFRFLELSSGSGDGIIGTRGQWAGMNFFVDLDEPLSTNGVHTMSFEYGARFNGGRLRIAVGKNGEDTIATFSEPSERATGVHVKDLQIPANTSRIWFLYYYE